MTQQASVDQKNSEIGEDDGNADTDSDTNVNSSTDTDADADTDTDGDVTLVIEEQAAGFCFVDGVIESEHTGFTGPGYANTDNAIGKSAEWAVNAAGGPVSLEWRYASATDRPTSVIVNGTTVGSLSFSSTVDWTSWTTASSTADLAAGDNSIRLEALSSSGLGNIDNLTVTGAGISPGACDEDTDPDTDSDSDSDSDTDSDSNLIGWASVSECGPKGTTGGGDGEPTVTVTSGGNLKDVLSSSGALVIAISGRIDSPGKISGVRDKTLIGIDHAEIKGGFGLDGARNVIIENVKFSDGSDDTFELSGCECIWFDHCEFIDGLDGNLDIVRASNLVTVSWSRFYYTRGHGHMFSNLCGNGQPRQEDEGKINITFHHNWWGAGVSSRTPRVRYGKVHVFNNYYHYEKVSGDGGEDYCIGAGYMSKLLVESNYFDKSKHPIVWMSDEGTAEVVEKGNSYVNAGGVVTRGSSFEPPYDYSMDPAAQIKDIVMAGAGVR